MAISSFILILCYYYVLEMPFINCTFLAQQNTLPFFTFVDCPTSVGNVCCLSNHETWYFTHVAMVTLHTRYRSNHAVSVRVLHHINNMLYLAPLLYTACHFMESQCVFLIFYLMMACQQRGWNRIVFLILHICILTLWCVYWYYCCQNKSANDCIPLHSFKFPTKNAFYSKFFKTWVP